MKGSTKGFLAGIILGALAIMPIRYHFFSKGYEEGYQRGYGAGLSYVEAGHTPRKVIVGDYNRDGILDALVISGIDENSRSNYTRIEGLPERLAR